MDSKTLNALNDSIAHWERLATGKRTVGESHQGNSCALCSLFFEDDNLLETGNYCEGCPVYEKTGQRGCGGSPWMEANNTFHLQKNSELKRLGFVPYASDALEIEACAHQAAYDSPEFKAVAQKQLEFLKSLPQ